MDQEHRLLAFESLIGEVSAALAETVDLLKARADDTCGDEIASSLADLVGLLEKRKAVDLTALVKAVQQLRITAPEVCVTVEPTPVQVTVQPAEVTVQVLPPKDLPTEWEVRLPGLYGAPDRVMTIRKKAVAP